MALSIENIRKEIQKDLDQDPTFSSGVNISVTTEKKGSLFSKKEYIVLSGAVRNELEKKKVEDIAHLKAGDTEVVVRLRIAR